MTPRPSRSSLFPYTTLFRSKALAFNIVIVFPAPYGVLLRPAEHSRSSSISAGPKATLPPDFQESRQDRKSTRLNSSHSQISYAVFCLKKKIMIHQRPHKQSS